MLFFRQFQHLLPRARPWNLTIQKTLRSFFEGLANGAPVQHREHIDNIYLDVFPKTTRELAEWEKTFGLLGEGTEAERRDILDATWKAQGGQDLVYIESVLHAAGFNNLFAYDPTDDTSPPYTIRDPRVYTTLPLIGVYQDDGVLGTQPQCGAVIADQPQCNGDLVKSPGYLVDKNLSDRVPPPIPDDENFWPFFLYIAGDPFPTPGVVSVDRQAELERLLLKICPMHVWIVLITDAGNDVFDESFNPPFN